MESQEVISVTTNTAVLKVARQGRQGGPVILTFHDLGLNHVTNYKVREHANKIAVFCSQLTFSRGSDVILWRLNDSNIITLML